LSKQDSLGDGWLKALHPDDLQPTIEAWTKSVRTGTPCDVEYRVRGPEGEWRWIRARATARRAKSGEIILWYGTAEDIQPHKLAIEKLRQSQALLQAVFHAVPVGIVIAQAPDGLILMSNPRADDILRRPVIPQINIEEYRRPGAFTADGRRLESHEFPLARAILHGETTEAEEILYQHVDGSRAWISVSAAPVQGADGEIACGVLAILDIDEIRRETQRLTDLVTQLKKLLDSRT
jgi:PAS domain-containing protein